MRNCLVTKLKGTVDNPNLLKLGQCVIEGYKALNSSDNIDLFVFTLPIGQSVTVTPKSGTIYFVEDINRDNPGTPITGPTTLTITTEHYSIYTPDFGAFLIDDFYNKATSIIQAGVPVHVWNYMTSIVEGNILFLPSNYYSNKLSDIDKATLPRITGTIDFGYIDYDCSIMDYIAACTNATKIYCVYYMRPCTTEEFGAALNTNVISFIGPRGNSQFGGTIEGLVAAQRAKGRTSGRIDWFNGNAVNSVTFDGEPIGGAWDTLTWTANTITFLGKTINV